MSFLGLETYELLKEQKLNDIQSQGYILRHKKTGARVALVCNDDDNKVFYIGFRTPPQDETGVPHIIEHTVLCGSQKFPAKDPFVELCKGSLNTFLNAMTYPDKTLYPVASYNEQDFKNLMDVYLDAVFHPNILKHKEIFMQEGWHYELEDEDAPLIINGVVYNEMKGAYSSPDEILTTALLKALFPDNAYGKDSGGNPKQIPNLTYEDYIAFYKKYYHPSNSYIYLYGDFDIRERLEWMDQMYLSEFDAIEVDSAIVPQKPFDAVLDITEYYPIASDESEENNTYLVYAKVMKESLDKEFCEAFSMIEYALVSASGAIVRQALIDAGIGDDVYGGFEDDTLQTTFTIVAKNANPSDKERFVEIIEETLRKVVAEGINKESILAAIHSDEFRFREADYGRYPKGLLYGLQATTWLHDDTTPFLYMDMLDTYEFLKEQTKTGYYEELIRTYLLENNHGVHMALVPKKGLNQKDEERLEQELAAYKASLSKEELCKLIEETKKLRQYQEEPTTEEDLKKIPMLSRNDLRKEALPLSNIEETIDGVQVIRHDYFTNGIDYVTAYFTANDISLEDYPYLSCLRNLLGFVDTEHYTYADLSNAVNIHTGGVSTGLSLTKDYKDEKKLSIRYELGVKALEDKLSDAMELLTEILFTSKLEDVKRVSEIVAQTKSRLQSALSSSGHLIAATRCTSYFSRGGLYKDASSGVAYYDAICRMDLLLKDNPQEVIAKFRELANRIFCKERMEISFTADAESYKRALPVMTGFINRFPRGTAAGEMPEVVPVKRNEGLTDASTIQYVARSGDYRKHGYVYNGALNVLKNILSYDYMWLNIRMKGGAYGCMCSFGRMGTVYLVSYRDPNLGKTNEAYEQIPEYLRNFTADEREMTKYIIGTLGSFDTPMGPESKGNRSMNAYFRNMTIEDLQKERDEILNAGEEDIRAFAGLMEAVLSDENICVVGSETNIQREKDLFLTIRKLTE